MAELVYALVLGTSGATLGSSSLPPGTTNELNGFFKAKRWEGGQGAPPISLHFSKRIWGPAFGGAHCFFAKKQVRAKDFFGTDLFRKKVCIPCDSVKVLCVFWPLKHRFEP